MIEENENPFRSLIIKTIEFEFGNVICLLVIRERVRDEKINLCIRPGAINNEGGSGRFARFKPF